MENSFSVFEVLQTAWDITRKNLLVLMGYSAVAFVSLFVLQLLSVYIMSSSNALLNFLGLAIILFANSAATLGFYKLTFKLIDSEDEDFDFYSVIPSWKNISSFISITLLIGFIVTTLSLIFKQLLTINLFQNYYNTLKSTPWLVEALALLAFIVFVVLVVRFMFFPCFIVDDNSSSFESLRQSRELTFHNLTRIITVLLLVIGFIVIGFLALGVGIIVTYPFTNVILVVTYRKLVYSYGVEHPSEQLLH